MATVRIGLKKPKFRDNIPMIEADIVEPTMGQLFKYAIKVKSELDGFLVGNGYMDVHICQGDCYVQCVLSMTRDANIEIDEDNVRWSNAALDECLGDVSEEISIQLKKCMERRELLPLYDEPHLYIYKAPWSINWTEERAIHDAGCIIYQCVSAEM